MNVTCLKKMVDETLRSVCLRWSTNVYLNHGLRYDTTAWKRESPRPGERFGMESLQTSIGCVNTVSASHAIELYSETVPWQRERFSLN